MSSSEKLEVGLARARASIQRAIVTRNCTSYKEESFLPRRSIYRNAYAFHQLRQTHSPLLLYILCVCLCSFNLFPIGPWFHLVLLIDGPHNPCQVRITELVAECGQTFLSLSTIWRRQRRLKENLKKEESIRIIGRHFLWIDLTMVFFFFVFVFSWGRIWCVAHQMIIQGPAKYNNEGLHNSITHPIIRYNEVKVSLKWSVLNFSDWNSL